MIRRSTTLSLVSRLAAGAVLLVLPGAVTLLAEQKTPPRAAAPATTTSQPATTASAAELRERAKQARKEEELARVMEFFRVTQPDVYEQAKTLQATDPARFEKLVGSTVGTVNRLEELKKRSPKLFELRMRDLELNYQSLRKSRILKQPDLASSERERISGDLVIIVTAQFETRQRIRQQEIEELKAQLKALEANLEKDGSDKDARIKKRVEDLVERTPRLEW
jgi:hypothetical protein